jgi:hypothetical protein
MTEYMVLYIDVVDGEIVEVYEANDIPTDLKRAEEVPDAKLDPKIFKKPKASTTFYASSSPGCRYVHKSNCRYVKVCR